MLILFANLEHCGRRLPVHERVQFGVFELDSRTLELRKRGMRLYLPPQPFQVLLLLLEHPGELVTREELRSRIWPEGTFVDFERSLTVAVNKIRNALGDSADSARFIETVPRRGYRFITSVNRIPVNQAEKSPGPGFSLKKRLGPVFFTAAALLVIAGSAVIFHHFRATRTPSGAGSPRVVPLTSYRGIEQMPAFSPDGRQVAFVWKVPNQVNWDVYVKLIGDEGVPLRLTKDPAEDRSPAWSPDGRQIAFLRVFPGRGAGLFVTSALGGSERKVAEVKVLQIGAGISWTPDGKWLLVPEAESPERSFALYLVSVESGEMRRVTNPPATWQGDSYGVFSPDGRMLAIVRSPAYLVHRVYLLHLSTGFQPLGEPKPASDPACAAFHPTWMPNGDFVYAKRCGSDISLWRVPPTGGPERPASTIGRIPSPDFAISPAGDKLVYSDVSSDLDIWQVEIDGFQAGTRPGAPRSTQAVRHVLSSTKGEGNPYFSPDGKKIAFKSDRSGTAQIWTCAADGSNPIQLTSLPIEAAGMPRWSPDGAQIVFDARAKGESDIWIIAANGGRPRRLTAHPAQDINPNWSRDGQSIYFSSNRTGEYQIWKIPAAPPTSSATPDDGAVQITKHGGWYALESFDGRTLYYSKRFSAGPVCRLPVAGGEEVAFIENLSRGLNFDLAGNGIYFNPADPRFAVAFYRFSTGKTELVAGIDKLWMGGGMCVSPDRRMLLFQAVGERRGDLWLVDNFRF